MVPFGPTTGPGVTAPSRCRRQRTAPAVGPADTEEPPCRESCNAAGHGAQLALAGAAAGGVNPDGEEIEGVPEPCGLLGPHPAATHAITATTTTAAAGLSTSGITTPTILAHPNVMTTTPFEVADGYYGSMTKQDWNLVAETAKDTGSGLVDSLGAMIDYPKHHDISQRVIDTLQGMQNRAAWVCLYAPDAVQEFIDELAAREEQPPEDSFCIWCHHRDERERHASSSAKR